MILRFALTLPIILLFISCSVQDGKNEKQTPLEPEKVASGLKIETSINHGLTPHASPNIWGFLIHTTTTITNDSTIPIHVDMSLAREIKFPSLCNDETFKVFLWPDEFQGAEPNYESTSSSFDEFVNLCWDDPAELSVTLAPGDSCSATIGALYPSPTTCGVFPRVLFSNDDRALYDACGSEGNSEGSDPNPFELHVQLAFYYGNRFGSDPDSCLTIGCGNISYP